jgi:hypothetical protein
MPIIKKGTNTLNPHAALNPMPRQMLSKSSIMFLFCHKISNLNSLSVDAKIDQPLKCLRKKVAYEACYYCN